MDFSDVMELLQRGAFDSVGSGFASGAVSLVVYDRGAVALICLHGLLADNFSNREITASVEKAFRFADAFIKKLKEPPTPPEEGV